MSSRIQDAARDLFIRQRNIYLDIISKLIIINYSTNTKTNTPWVYRTLKSGRWQTGSSCEGWRLLWTRGRLYRSANPGKGGGQKFNAGNYISFHWIFIIIYLSFLLTLMHITTFLFIWCIYNKFVITFKFIVLNPSEKYNHNPNLVYINSQKNFSACPFKTKNRTKRQ